jgi:hypothetical protein
MMINSREKSALVAYLKHILANCDEFQSENDVMEKFMGAHPSKFHDLTGRDLVSLTNRFTVYMKLQGKEVPAPPDFFFNFAGECESIDSQWYQDRIDFDSDVPLNPPQPPAPELNSAMSLVLKEIIRKIAKLEHVSPLTIAREVYPDRALIDCVGLNFSEEELQVIAGYWMSKLDIQIEVADDGNAS